MDRHEIDVVAYSGEDKKMDDSFQGGASVEYGGLCSDDLFYPQGPLPADSGSKIC